MKCIKQYLIINKLNAIRNHTSAHIYLIHKHHIILGYNARYNILASIGGYKDKSENLIQTISREYEEETLNAITPTEQLNYFITNSSICISDNLRYSIFCNISNLELNYNTISHNFKRLALNPNLTSYQKEYDDIITLPLLDIYTSIKDESYQVLNMNIRKENIDIYRWYFNNVLSNNHV